MNQNDLDRHLASVHNITPKDRMTKIYFCCAPGCRKAKKRWPRSDNFREHVRRIHPTECADEIVRRSVFIEERGIEVCQLISSRSQRDAREFPQLESSFQDQPKNAFTLQVQDHSRKNVNANKLPEYSDLDPSLLSIPQDFNEGHPSLTQNLANYSFPEDWPRSSGHAGHQENDVDSAPGPSHPPASFEHPEVSDVDNLGLRVESLSSLASAHVEYPKEVDMPESELLTIAPCDNWLTGKKELEDISKTNTERLSNEKVIDRLSDRMIHLVNENLETHRGDDSSEIADSGSDSRRSQKTSQGSSRSASSLISSTADSELAAIKSTTKKRKSSTGNPEISKQLKLHLIEMIRSELSDLRGVFSGPRHSRSSTRSGDTASSTSSKSTFRCEKCSKMLFRVCDYK